jgi:hypothetical protein
MLASLAAERVVQQIADSAVTTSVRRQLAELAQLHCLAEQHAQADGSLWQLHPGDPRPCIDPCPTKEPEVPCLEKIKSFSIKTIVPKPTYLKKKHSKARLFFKPNPSNLSEEHT